MILKPLAGPTANIRLFLIYLRPMEVLPTANFQPDILIAGIRLGEPMIGLTSILVSLVCFYAWFRLGKQKDEEDALKLYRIFFLLMGFSTLVGAIIGHFFIYCLPFVFKTPGWGLGMIAVSAFEQATIVRATPIIGPGWKRILSWINILELFCALTFVSSTLWFPGVEAHSAFGLLGIVLPLEFLRYLKGGHPGSRYVLLGILVLFGSVLVHILKISVSVWFCYFDIAHLTMCGAFWLFMLGAERNDPGSSV